MSADPNYGTLLDNDLMFVTLLDAAPFTATVATEMDITSIDDTPLVMVLATSGDQERNGPGLWRVFITINVFDVQGDRGWATCSAVYDTIHDWAMPGNGATAQGHVVGVFDTSTFTRVSFSEMQGKNVTQWTASFDLTIRAA